MNKYNPEEFIAVYKEQLVKQYQGNKLIEALPEIMSHEQIAKKLGHKSEFSSEEKKLPLHIRESSINRVFGYFRPLTIHIQYASKIGRMIRDGYLGRRMEPVRDLMTEEELKVYMADTSEQDIYDCVFSAGVIGMSGMGKTRSTARILRLYPQLIVHQRPYNTYQVVWIKLDCPSKGSLKQLCQNFFKAMDDILDSEYERIYQYKSIDYMLNKMADVAERHYLGLIVIDEIQHLVGAKGTGERDMLNFLVTMNNVVKVPVLLIGTPSARKLMNMDFRQARRMDGMGGIYWERIPNDRAWEAFVKGFWMFNWLREEQPLTQELIDTFHEESQGIIDVVLKLYAAAQLRALLMKTEKITPEDIRYVAEHDIPHMKEIIRAIKVDPEMAEKMYGDVTAAKMEEIYKNVRKSCGVDDEFYVSGKKSNPIIGKAIAILSAYGVPDNYAEKYVKEAVKNNPYIDVKKVVDRVHNSYEKLTKSKMKKNAEGMKQSFLKYVNKAEEQDFSGYDELESDDLIKLPLEDFTMGIDD